MDISSYKSVTTSRDFKYSYFFSAPTPDKPILLLAHGFPSTSYDWRFQVEFFKSKGYGLIVPDMLGYGGTDKPSDPAQYKLRLICQDIVEILDAEKVDKVIAIGHDVGSILISRLANYYPDRFTAFAFLAVGYVPPSDAKFSDSLAQLTKLIGYEPYGYWYFFAEQDAHETLEKNIDSFYSLLFTDDPKLWVSKVGPTGAMKAWVEGDNRTKIASYLTEEEVDTQKALLLKGGLQGPLCWYKARVHGLDAVDVKNIAPERLIVHQPVFFGGATQDYVCLPALGKAGVSRSCKGPLTFKDYPAAHWVLWEAKDKLNDDLLDWIQTL